MNEISREEKFGITPKFIAEYFEYKEGLLYWKKKFSKMSPVKVGGIAGSLYKSGHYAVSINYKKYYIHRLVWILYNGFIPRGVEVDHINRNPEDNRLNNLRLATRRENAMNTDRNTSGYPGVIFNKFKNKWCAQIQLGTKSLNLGLFDTIEEAVEARRNAERELGIEVREEFFRASYLTIPK